jgi:hypothetical protein
MCWCSVCFRNISAIRLDEDAPIAKPSFSVKMLLLCKK